MASIETNHFYQSLKPNTMHKYFKPIWYSLINCFTLILVASCNNGDGGKKDKDDSVTETSEPPKAALFGGFYDTLYVDRVAFTTLADSSKIIFKNTFQANDALTLHGWVAKPGNTFDVLPYIKFLNSRKGNITYGPGTYFGNIVLHKRQFQKIKDKLLSNPTAQYVLFAPTVSGTDFFYKAYITKDNPATLESITILALIQTGAEANPSPPKDY